MKGYTWSKYASVEDRFLAKISKTDACWLWTATKDQKGYGRFGMVINKKYISGYQAHRASWILFEGSIPDGMSVLHSCDKTSCVNPEHLYLGTHRDNMDDRVARGTRKGKGLGPRYELRKPNLAVQGERHWNVKLSDEDVAIIRAIYAVGEAGQKTLAKCYSVSKQHISKLIRRERRVA